MIASRRRLHALAVVAMSLASSCVRSPEGAREDARSASPDGWRYVALGDSLASGSATVPGYPSRYAERIRRDLGVGVRLTNLARGGMRADELLAQLRRNRTVRAAVASADVVTWNIGGNDLAAALTSYRTGSCAEPDLVSCMRAELLRVRHRWSEITDAIAELRPDGGGLVRTMNDYNPFVSFLRATGTFDDVRPEAEELARFKCAAAAQHGFECADVYAAFNGPDGGRDPVAAGLVLRGDVHPTARGQELMADALAELGYEGTAAEAESA